jgi:hypothetical protein
VDQVWIFPPRTLGAKESGLAVLALFAEADARGPRRTLYTLAYEAESLKGGKTRWWRRAPCRPTGWTASWTGW